jgi:hypothetical protein
MAGMSGSRSSTVSVTMSPRLNTERMDLRALLMPVRLSPFTSIGSRGPHRVWIAAGATSMASSTGGRHWIDPERRLTAYRSRSMADGSAHQGFCLRI